MFLGVSIVVAFSIVFLILERMISYGVVLAWFPCTAQRLDSEIVPATVPYIVDVSRVHNDHSESETIPLYRYALGWCASHKNSWMWRVGSTIYIGSESRARHFDHLTFYFQKFCLPRKPLRRLDQRSFSLYCVYNRGLQLVIIGK